MLKNKISKVILSSIILSTGLGFISTNDTLKNINSNFENVAKAETIVKRFTFNDTTNVRTGPSLNYGIYKKLPAGYNLKGIVYGSWLKITEPYALKDKYISTSVLTTLDPNASTGYNLFSGYNGIKVYLVQKYFGMYTSPMNSTMNNDVISKIKNFQKLNNIYPSGVLTKETWDKMNMKYNFNIDTWKKAPDVPSYSSSITKTNAMVNFAKKQLGKPYIWGSTGPIGYDCSGLVIQSMRAGGFNPKYANNFMNVRPSSNLASGLWSDSSIKKISWNELKYGDLVFYANNGKIGHVSIYVGNNTVINAIGNKIQYSSLNDNFGIFYKAGAKRVF